MPQKKKRNNVVNIVLLLIVAVLVILLLLSKCQAPLIEEKRVDTTSNTMTTQSTGSGKTLIPILTEYQDYSCPHCRSFYLSVYPKLKEDFIDTGKIRFVLKDFPVVQEAPDIYYVHNAPYCAREQDKYVEMHDELYKTNKELTNEYVLSLARNLPVGDFEDFKKCMEERRYDALIRQNEREGFSHGFNGTPSFTFGSLKFTGNQDYSFMKESLENEIEKINKK